MKVIKSRFISLPNFPLENTYNILKITILIEQNFLNRER